MYNPAPAPPDSSPPPLACPHCDSPAPPAQRFCTACGKRLPAADDFVPHYTPLTQHPRTPTGAAALITILQRRSRRHLRTALVALALLNAASAVAISLGGDVSAEHMGPSALAIAASGAILSLIYLALAIWARSSPIGAGVVAVSIIATLMLTGMCTAFALAAAGLPVQIIVLIYVSRGLREGLRIEALRHHAPAAQPPAPHSTPALGEIA